MRALMSHPTESLLNRQFQVYVVLLSLVICGLATATVTASKNDYLNSHDTRSVCNYIISELLSKE